jgi:hypothetical protein
MPKTTPSFSELFTPRAAVTIPIAQAGAIALSVFISATAFATLRQVPAPYVLGVAWGGLSFSAWFAITTGWWRSRVDGALTLAKQPARLYSADTPLRVEVRQQQGRWVDWHDLQHINEEQLTKMAAGIILEGKAFSGSCFGGRGKIFSRAEFEGVRDEFLRYGFARWASAHSRTRGCVLTAKGTALLRGVVVKSGANPRALRAHTNTQARSAKCT